MHRDIDTALLRALVAVVETGSVTGAAALLNRTQAAVSQQIRWLEELFSVELFSATTSDWCCGRMASVCSPMRTG
jgi:DNA-binding transcriptional LysR family regulator